jgi:hypothetical protein
MATIARKHNLIVRSALNKTRNASHAEIETFLLDSKRVVLTALAARDAYDFKRLRTAQFRKTLAQEAMLFPEFQHHHGDGYYGVILHGAHPEHKNSLDFAYLAFPYADCKGWFGKYDLFLLAQQAADSEAIEDKAQAILRSDIIRKAE